MSVVRIKKPKTEIIAEKFYKAACNLRVTAKNLGVSRRTLSRWIASDNNLYDALRSVKEGLIDDAESLLLQKMREGDGPSIMFFLKCQGKDRGWVERQDIRVNSQNFEFNLGEVIECEPEINKEIAPITEISKPNFLEYAEYREQ